MEYSGVLKYLNWPESLKNQTEKMANHHGIDLTQLSSDSKGANVLVGDISKGSVLHVVPESRKIVIATKAYRNTAKKIAESLSKITLYSEPTERQKEFFQALAEKLMMPHNREKVWDFYTPTTMTFLGAEDSKQRNTVLSSEECRNLDANLGVVLHEVKTFHTDLHRLITKPVENDYSAEPG